LPSGLPPPENFYITAFQVATEARGFAFRAFLSLEFACEFYPEYPGVGHNSWDQIYNNEEAMKWLFA
jgi:hypothetical protein